MSISRIIQLKILFKKKDLQDKTLTKLKKGTITSNDIQEIITDAQDGIKTPTPSEDCLVEIDKQIDKITGFSYNGYSVDDVQSVQERRDSFKVSFTIDIELDTDSAPKKEEKIKINN